MRHEIIHLMLLLMFHDCDQKGLPDWFSLSRMASHSPKYGSRAHWSRTSCQWSEGEFEWPCTRRVGGDWMRVGELIAFLTWLHAGCLSKVSVCVYLETKALCPTADLNPLSPATYLTNALTYKYRRRGQKGPGAIGHGGGRGCIFREGPSSCHLTHVATWFWGHRQHCLI